MAFKLSTRSMDRLIGVDERMVAVVNGAIHKTKIDFGVICGMRTSDVPIRWGAAWTVPNIAYFDGTMEDAMNSYIDTRRTQGRRPFIDGPHFELMV